MTPTRVIRLFDKIALRLFNTAVLAGLGVVAVGMVAQ